MTAPKLTSARAVQAAHVYPAKQPHPGHVVGMMLMIPMSKQVRSQAEKADPE